MRKINTGTYGFCCKKLLGEGMKPSKFHRKPPDAVVNNMPTLAAPKAVAVIVKMKILQESFI